MEATMLMRRRWFWAATLLFLMTAATTFGQAPDLGGRRVVVYFTEWSVYAAHDYYEVSKIPFDKVTHINYAFVRADENNRLQILDPFASLQKTFGGDPWGSEYAGNLGQLIKYKALHPHVRTLISIGGWTKGDQFHRIAKSAQARQEFADACVQFIRTYSMDGVDIDWEYPGIDRPRDPNDQYDLGCPGGPEDGDNFTLLLQTVRQKLDEAIDLPLIDRSGNVKVDEYGNTRYRTEPYLLTIAAPAGAEKISLTYPEDYARYLDFINVMTYDMHGGWENLTGHQSPLYSNPEDPHDPRIVQEYTVDHAMNFFLSFGVPSGKLNMGVPFYSRGWANVGGGTNGLFGDGSPTLQGLWGPGGQNPYYHVKSLERGAGWTKHWDSYSLVPWLYNSSSGDMLTYDDPRSMGIKVDYVVQNGFGGVMAWEIDADDNDELINTINNHLVNGDPDTEPPSVPANLSAGITTSNSIDLSWNASTDNRGVTAYEIFDDAVPANLVKAVPGNQTTITITGLEPQTSYSFAVLAKDGAGNSSALSSYINATTGGPDLTPPTVPTGLISTGKTATSVSLFWNGSTDDSGIVAGYRIYVNGTTHSTASNTIAQITGLTANTSYFLAVSAYDSANNESAKTPSISVRTDPQDDGPATGVPGTPNLSKNAWDGEADYMITMDMWWGNNGSSIELYENNILVETKSLVDNSPNHQTAAFAFNGKPNGTYIYRCNLINRFGTTASSDLKVTVTKGEASDTQPPAIPAGLSTGQVTTSSIAISWNPSTDNVGVTEYKIYVDGSFRQSSGSTSTTVTGLSPSTTYQLAVSAADGAGNESARSSPIQATTRSAGPDNSPPTIPQGLQGTAHGADAVSLTWSPSADNVGVTGYKIFKDGSYEMSSAATSAVVSELSASTTYLFSVLAFDAEGNESAQSQSVSVTTDEEGQIGDFKIIGYVPDYNDIGAEAIQFDKLTHINYAFLIPTTTGGVRPFERPGKLQAIVDAAHANGVKVQIAVGGWQYQGQELDAVFETLSRSASSRSALVRNILDVVEAYDLDGVDMDWEFPDPPQEGNGSADNFQALMTELSNALKARGKILTAAVHAGATPDGIDDFYWAYGVKNEVFAMVDFLNIMAYDGGDGDRHSPYTLAEKSLDYWTKIRGLEKRKAILGVPFYGRPRWAAYKDLVAADPDAPNKDIVMYQGSQVHYNGIPTIQQKTELAKQEGGGIMMWELTHDTTDDTSLLAAVYEAADGIVNPTDTIPPSVPQNLFSPRKTGYSVDLSWSASSDDSGVVKGYPVYQDGAYLRTVTGTSITVEGLNPGTTYAFAVSAIDRAGNESVESNSLSVTTSEATGNEEWTLGASYTVGDIVTYRGGTYICIQSHVVHSETWNPVEAPALWNPYSP